MECWWWWWSSYFIRLTSYKSDNWQQTIIMHLSCNVHDEHFCGTILQGLYSALRCYVASYIILVYDVVCCRYVPPWWCVKFYTTMVHDVVWILGYVLWGTYLFYAQFWILDLFSKIQKFGRSGRRPSSVGLAVVRRSLSAFHMDVVNTFHVDVRIFRASRFERFLNGARVRGSNPVPCRAIFS